MWELHLLITLGLLLIGLLSMGSSVSGYRSRHC